MKNKSLSLIFLGLGICFFIPTSLSYLGFGGDINDIYEVRGEYDSDLNNLVSVSMMDRRLDEIIDDNQEFNSDTSLIVRACYSLVSNRFYHGTCRYNFKDNWLAHLMGRFIWHDIHMKVIPNEILDSKMAVCNQANIVFQELLRKRLINYRTVGLNNHMLTEVKYNSSWHAFDPDYEAEWPENVSTEELIKSDNARFREIYNSTEGSSFNDHFEKLLNTEIVTYYPENQILASNMRFFQQVLSVLSNLGWMIFMALWLIIRRLS